MCVCGLRLGRILSRPNNHRLSSEADEVVGSVKGETCTGLYRFRAGTLLLGHAPVARRRNLYMHSAQPLLLYYSGGDEALLRTWI